MLHIRLLGSPRIDDDDGTVRTVRGQKPWAVLARVLLADRPLTRRELSAELFPDTDDPLGSLRWCLASLRKAIGDAGVLTGDPVRRDLPSWVDVDLDLVSRGDVEPMATGDLLDGIDPSCSPEFSTWLLVVRQQVASRIAAQLRDATITAISRGDHDRAIRLAELAARRSPFDEGAQILLVKALTAAGHHDTALAHVAEVEAVFRTELRCDPTPALRSAARVHLAADPPGVSASAIAESLLGSGRAAIAAGAIDAGLDSLRRAGERAEAAGDEALLGRCLLELGSALVHTVRGFDDEGSVLLEQAVLLARSAGDRSTAVAGLRERGYVDTLVGRRPEAERRLDEAAALADGDPAMLAPIHAVAGLNLTDWGRLDQAASRFELAVELARSAGDRRWEGWALGLGAWTWLADSRPGLASEWSLACLDLVHDVQWSSFEPWPMAVLAEARLLGAGAATGSPELERGFAMSCQLADPCWEGASGRVLALHHARNGDVDTALAWIGEARRRAARNSDTWVGVIGAILLSDAEIRAGAGDSAGADAAARELVGLAARSHLDALLPRAVTLLSANR